MPFCFLPRRRYCCSLWVWRCCERTGDPEVRLLLRSAVVCVSLVLPLLPGCRAPSIPAEPSALEYAAWHDVLAFEADAAPLQAVVIWPETLPLDERQLQFQRCLPRHMRDIFDDASEATLSVNVPEDWLRLPSGQTATLGRGGVLGGGGTVEFVRLSRVAFSRFHRDGYVWAERRSCMATGGHPQCGERQGQLLHVIHKGDRWTAEQTDCGATALGDDD